MEFEPKILVIVPAYNEEESIENTLKSLIELKKDLPNLDICVVNDGSKDNTRKIVEKFNVHLLNLPFNLGIGSAMQTGYKFAFENEYDIAVQFDADGQHGKDDLNSIIQPIINGECDMVVGSRFVEKTDYKGSSARRAGIFYFTILLKLLTGQKFTDPTSGYRAKNKKVIELFAYNYPKDYPEPEVLIYLLKKGLKIKEISVHMKDRQGGNSSIQSLQAVYYMFKVSLAIFMQNLIKETK